MLVCGSRLAFERALDEVRRQPAPEQQARPRGAEERVDERIRVGGLALGCEQVERDPRMPLAARGVEVAVDRQFCVTRRLERGSARRRRECLLAPLDGGRAAFAPVVETGEVEQRPCLQRSGAIRDRRAGPLAPVRYRRPR